MSKVVYTWDADKHFNKIKLVDDNYQLQSNETFTKPKDGLYTPITWSGSDWVGTSYNDWLKAQPKVETKPSNQQKLNSTLTMQVAQLMAAQKKQEIINAQLTLENAKLAQQLKGGTK